MLFLMFSTYNTEIFSKSCIEHLETPEVLATRSFFIISIDFIYIDIKYHSSY